MLARVLSCAIVGLDGALIEVEVDIAPGLPAFTIVGLPDAAVQEAKDRVRAAIRNTGYQFPMKRITVNLAPADLKKVGPSYDLPIAIGILAASGQVPESWRPAARSAGMAASNGAAAAEPVHAAAASPVKQEASAAGKPAAAPPVTEALQDAAVVAELEALLGGLVPGEEEREESLLDTAMFLGELALDGSVPATDGMLPMVGYGARARDTGRVRAGGRRCGGGAGRGGHGAAGGQFGRGRAPPDGRDASCPQVAGGRGHTPSGDRLHPRLARRERAGTRQAGAGGGRRRGA